jgi:hypothetical protein
MRIELKWGAVLALLVAAWTLVVHLLGIYTFRIQYAATVDGGAIVLPVAAITLGLLELRRERGGTLPIIRGILFGLGVAIVSGPLTVGVLWGYHHYVNPEWLTILVSFEQGKLAAAGVSADEIAAQMAQLQGSGTDRSQIIGGLFGTLAVSLILSLVITLVLGVLARLRSRSM